MLSQAKRFKARRRILLDPRRGAGTRPERPPMMDLDRWLRLEWEGWPRVRMTEAREWIVCE